MAEQSRQKNTAKLTETYIDNYELPVNTERAVYDSELVTLWFLQYNVLNVIDVDD
jgi:hypothetical protein